MSTTHNYDEAIADLSDLLLSVQKRRSLNDLHGLCLDEVRRTISRTLQYVGDLKHASLLVPDDDDGA